MSAPRRRRLDARRSGPWVLAACSLLLGGYGLLVYPSSEAALTAAEGLVKRRLDRIERRTRIEQQPAASPVTLRRDLERLTARRDELAARRDELAARFVAARNGEALQSQRHAIATLAERTGLQVLRQASGVQQANRTHDGTAAPPLDARTARPYLDLEARGDYWSVRGFLFGLEALDFVTAATTFSLAVPETGGEAARARAATPQLRVHLRLSL